MRVPAQFEWEIQPEYLSLQQLSHLIGGILAGLPRRQSRRAEAVLVPATFVMARAIVGTRAEIPPPGTVPIHEREAYRSSGLRAVSMAGSALRRLKARPRGPRAELTAAIEVLERIEAGLRYGPMPGGPG